MYNYYFEIKYADTCDTYEETGFYAAETLRRATNDLYNYYGVNEQDEENVLIQFSITPFDDGPIILPAKVCETYLADGDWNKILRPAGCMDAGKVGY